ncbi:MAG TPA: aldehyde dehydrogenase family protein, partial [Blastocatellia bacterium]|nr:aldehyde dehydrogenase family protein [Blastocatellia bacterium]
MSANLPATGTRAEIISVNPATLEELGHFAVASAAQVDQAVARARAARPAWAALSYRNRARYILKVRRALYDRKEEIIRIISDETGKPEFEALSTEVFMASD